MENPTHYRAVLHASRSALHGTDTQEAEARAIYSRLYEELAYKIVNAHVEIKHCSHHREYILDLYVATPDQFWEMVNREAYKLFTTFSIDAPSIKQQDLLDEVLGEGK